MTHSPGRDIAFVKYAGTFPANRFASKHFTVCCTQAALPGEARTNYAGSQLLLAGCWDRLLRIIASICLT